MNSEARRGNIMAGEERPARFKLTPHKLVMCILLYSCSTSGVPFSQFIPLPGRLRHQLAVFLLHLAKASDGFLEPSLEELGQDLVRVLEKFGVTLKEQLASQLLSFSSPEDLCNFFVSLRELFSTATIANAEQFQLEPGSPLGMLVRRCILSFNNLSFEGTCRLLTAINLYHQRTTTRQSLFPDSLSVKGFQEEHEQLDGANSPVGPHSGRIFSELVDHPWSETNVPSALKEKTNCVTDGGFSTAFGNEFWLKARGGGKGQFLRGRAEVEKFLQDQAAVIERDVWGVSMNALNSKLLAIEELARDMPQVHYMQFLNSLSHRDYPSAMDSVHRFFDYSAGDGAAGRCSSSDSRSGSFQAGLLTLGSMHASFGHITMACQALRESVRIAQQNNDDGCLLHALASLSQLLSEVSTNTSNQGTMNLPGIIVPRRPYLVVQQNLLLLLKNCSRRAFELRLPKLVAFSRVAIARFELQTLRHSSDLLNTRHLSASFRNRFNVTQERLIPASVNGQPLAVSGGNLSLGSASMQTTGSWGNMCRSVLKLAGISHLLRASSFELYGSEPLVQASATVHVACYMDVASADDLSLGYVKLAQNFASSRGFLAGLKALSFSTKKFPHLGKYRVLVTQLQLALDWAICRGSIRVARMISCDQAALVSHGPGTSMEQKLHANYGHAQILLASGYFSEAQVAAKSLFALCWQENKQVDSIMLLLLMGQIHKQAGSAVPGLPYGLACFTICQSLNLDVLQATAVVTLAELWVGLGMMFAQQAHTLLLQYLPVILGHGSLSLQGRTHLIIAHFHLSNPAFSVEATPNIVLEPLQQAAHAFETVENMALAGESYYWQAIIYDALGQKCNRDKAALSFKLCTLSLIREQFFGVDFEPRAFQV